MSTHDDHDRRHVGDDTGSVTVFFAISMLGLLLLIGLVADGGAKLRATQHADGVAAEAARAGGQALDVPAAVSGNGTQVDRTAALNAASAFLRRAGYDGTVTVSDDRTHLVVAVTITQPTVFLNLIGISSTSVTGHARVALVQGITGGGT
ncbi:pilus assembly protein TadG-related protein [Cellulomonas sp. URHD0024]|uniref:pilus assembly protein TadG-related protein n=1 Tax=Cellulomonas sp. URHD0024 TaxID=1302620 RepID=UPI0004177152|nr:pilus assembly protein TadG-related protein [Cellulomonas sp. URHD0024]